MRKYQYKGFICPDGDDIRLAMDKNRRKFGASYGLFNRMSDDIENEYYNDESDEFWGRKTHEPTVNMYAYFSSDECTLEEAMIAFDKKMYGGEFVLDVANEGYSDWTITGYNVETATLGGHDLMQEFAQHKGEYMHLIVEVCDENDE